MDASPRNSSDAPSQPGAVGTVEGIDSNNEQVQGEGLKSSLPALATAALRSVVVARDMAAQLPGGWVLGRIWAALLQTGTRLRVLAANGSETLIQWRNQYNAAWVMALPSRGLASVRALAARQGTRLVADLRLARERVFYWLWATYNGPKLAFEHVLLSYRLTSARRERENLFQINDVLEEHSKALSSRNDALNEEIEVLKRTLSYTQAQLDNARANNNVLQAENSRFQQKLQIERNRVGNLLAQGETDRGTIRGLEAKLETFRALNSQLQSDNEKLGTELRGVREDLVLASGLAEELQAELREAREEVDQASSETEELSNKIAGLEKQVRALTEPITNLTGERDSARAALAAAEQKKTALANELREARGEADQASSENENLRNEIANLEIRVSVLTESKSNITRERDSARAALAAVEQEKTALANEVTTLRNAHSAAVNRCNGLQARVQELEAQLQPQPQPAPVVTIPPPAPAVDIASEYESWASRVLLGSKSTSELAAFLSRLSPLQRSEFVRLNNQRGATRVVYYPNSGERYHDYAHNNGYPTTALLRELPYRCRVQCRVCCPDPYIFDMPDVGNIAPGA